ncbi:MAG TPA: BON domain-containing protein, partial [Chloroflexota bacterium]|nr:BON domain-containing protein [Chloroflexota bacterium]
TGTVPSKEIKHAAGDDAWWLPGVDDIDNQLTVEAPRRVSAEETSPVRGGRGRGRVSRIHS